MKVELSASRAIRQTEGCFRAIDQIARVPSADRLLACACIIRGVRAGSRRRSAQRAVSVRFVVKQLVAVSIALAGSLSMGITGALHAQGANNTGQTVEGGVSFINPGTPLVPESEANSR